MLLLNTCFLLLVHGIFVYVLLRTNVLSNDLCTIATHRHCTSSDLKEFLRRDWGGSDDIGGARGCLTGVEVAVGFRWDKVGARGKHCGSSMGAVGESTTSMWMVVVASCDSSMGEANETTERCHREGILTSDGSSNKRRTLSYFRRFIWHLLKVNGKPDGLVVGY